MELCSRPRFLYHRLTAAGAGAYYSECLAGCATSSPTFAPPILLGANSGDPTIRPLLIQAAPTILGALWPGGDGGTFTYAECAGSCDSPASWSMAQPTSFYLPHRSSMGVAALGSLRVAVTKGATGGDFYFECSGACATPSAVWSSVPFPNYLNGLGAAIELSTDPATGQVRRTGIWGSDPMAATKTMLYRECVGSCATPTNWVGGGLNGGLGNGGLGVGLFPALVLDQAGLPRILSLDSLPTGTLKLARCTQRPCATNIANWTISVIVPSGAGIPTAGKTPDGRTFFTLAVNGLVHMGIETGPNGTYLLWPTGTSCLGPAVGQSPAGYLGANDVLRRIAFVSDGGMAFRFEGG